MCVHYIIKNGAHVDEWCDTILPACTYGSIDNGTSKRVHRYMGISDQGQFLSDTFITVFWCWDINFTPTSLFLYKYSKTTVFLTVGTSMNVSNTQTISKYYTTYTVCTIPTLLWVRNIKFCNNDIKYCTYSTLVVSQVGQVCATQTTPLKV